MSQPSVHFHTASQSPTVSQLTRPARCQMGSAIAAPQRGGVCRPTIRFGDVGRRRIRGAGLDCRTVQALKDGDPSSDGSCRAMRSTRLSPTSASSAWMTTRTTLTFHVWDAVWTCPGPCPQARPIGTCAAIFAPAASHARDGLGGGRKEAAVSGCPRTWWGATRQRGNQLATTSVRAERKAISGTTATQRLHDRSAARPKAVAAADLRDELAIGFVDALAHFPAP